MNGSMRNQPCPCGSGHKTKRCCGRVRVEPSPRSIDDDCPICALLAGVVPVEAGEDFAVHDLSDPVLARQVIEAMQQAEGGETWIRADLLDELGY